MPVRVRVGVRARVRFRVRVRAARVRVMAKPRVARVRFTVRITRARDSKPVTLRAEWRGTSKEIFEPCYISTTVFRPPCVCVWGVVCG